MSNPVSDMMSEAVKSIKGLIDVNTVIGEPMQVSDGTVIIPISRVSFGFGGGGSEFASKVKSEENLFGGGMGGGASVKAEAFMIIANGNVRIVPVNGGSSPVERIVDMLPNAVDKINGFFSKNKNKNTSYDSGAAE